MNQLYAIKLDFLSNIQMIAIADETAVILLKFIEENEFDSIILQYQESFNLLMESNFILKQLKEELEKYFNGTLKNFSVPYKLPNNSYFQQKTLQAVCNITYGKTKSYKEIAQEIDNPLSMRAVGLANKSNPLMLLIPCHRVIHANRKIGGYAGGVDMKQWLLGHEKMFLNALI